MSAQQEKREQRLRLLEDHIGRSLADSDASGELRSAPSYGKPLDFGDGYEQTPAELRMGYKILKDAGVVPAEVELMREIAGLRQALDAAPGDDEATHALRRKLVERQQQLAVWLERSRSQP